MKKINEITKGKAKSMFTTDNDDYLVMHFSDDTSAFDGKKKEALLGKEEQPRAGGGALGENIH